MIIRSALLGCLAALPLLLASVSPGHANADPVITWIKFVQKPDGITAKIFGTHFGASPVKLPCVKCTITELQLIYFADDNEAFTPVTISQWNDSYIELRHLDGAPGTTAIFSVKNDAVGTNTAHVANLPGGPAAPIIRRLEFFRDHRHLKVVVVGSGFGQAPSGVPGSNDIPYFQLWIWATHGDVHDFPWAAGHDGCTVTLNYESWTDTRIVIDGFGQYYHGEDWYARKGYEVAVTLANNPGGGVLGPTAGRSSRIPW